VALIATGDAALRTALMQFRAAQQEQVLAQRLPAPAP